MREVTLPLENLLAATFVAFVGGFLLPFVLNQVGINLFGFSIK